jgi:transcription antitermination factor NusG
MRWRVHHQRGRKIRSLLPLFGGYVFFCGNENQRVEVLRTNRVANIIEVKNQEKLLNEMLPIERALNAGASLEPHKYLKKGQRCRVTAGPLGNMEGIVIQAKGGARLVLQIDMLGQAASVEIDTDLIETID